MKKIGMAKILLLSVIYNMSLTLSINAAAQVPMGFLAQLKGSYILEHADGQTHPISEKYVFTYLPKYSFPDTKMKFEMLAIGSGRRVTYCWHHFGSSDDFPAETGSYFERLPMDKVCKNRLDVQEHMLGFILQDSSGRLFYIDDLTDVGSHELIIPITVQNNVWIGATQTIKRQIVLGSDGKVEFIAKDRGCWKYKDQCVISNPVSSTILDYVLERTE